MNKKIKIIISGGGTGGHIFPAIAIANQLKEDIPNCEILFVGALGKMEMEKVPAAGYEIEGLPVTGFQRRITYKNITFFFKLFASMIKARKIFKQFKPDIVIGVGGYASGPMLRIAAKKNIITILQEQNSHAGITNQILGKKADIICVAYDNMEKFFPKEKIVFTGNPVRKEIINLNTPKSEAIKHFNLDDNKKTILSIGGSLGAGTINDSIIKNLELISRNQEIQLLWQSGKFYYHNAKNELDKIKPINVKMMAFIKEMDKAYQAADIIISRAGAISVSELCIAGKPVVFVPSPNVAEDHQTKNAMALVDKNAAQIVRDNEAREKLFKNIFELLNDKEKIKELSENITKLAVKNATELIVKEVKKQLKVN